MNKTKILMGRLTKRSGGEIFPESKTSTAMARYTLAVRQHDIGKGRKGRKRILFLVYSLWEEC